MDRTVLTLAVDSSQVGTAAAAFDRMVNAGNSAATSAGRVTSAVLAEGRTISQTLIPALNTGINRTRTLDETQAALGQDASRQFGQQLTALRTRADATGSSIRDAITNARVPSASALPRVGSPALAESAAQAGRSAPAAQVISTVGTTNLGQLASAAAGARLAIERQTEAINASRGAFAQLTQVAESTVRTYRQPAQGPVAPANTRAPSTAAAALTAAPQASPNAMREVAQAMSATATQATRVAATVTEANRAIAATPRATVLATSAAPATRAPLVAQPIVSAATGQRVPTATGSQTAQLAVDAGRAQTTVERLTAAARSQRSALAELAPAAAAAAGSYRQIAATPIRMEVPQGISATAAALASVATQAENANRAVTSLNRTVAPAARQGATPQTTAQQTSVNTTTTNVSGNAPSPAGMNAFAAATAHGTTATNAFAAAQGRAAETAQHLAEANARNEAANARLAAAIQRATAAQAAFDNASRSGSGSTESVATAQTRLQSAQAAVSVATANVARTQRGAAEASERHRAALASVGRQSTLTTAQTVQLHYQLHDFFVQVASGQSPLTAFIQQGSQLSGTFGGAGGAFRAVLSVLTPMRLAMGGVAGAVAALGYAFYEGSKQSKAFADAMVLSGNYAGQTEGKFNALTREVAGRSTATVGAAREAAQALLASGEVGPQVFSAATEAVTRYAEATGQTAADVVKDFASMGRAPTKWAEEHNRSMNFITAKQYDLIKSFDESGRSADAQAVIYNALNERLRKLEPNLTGLDRALINGKKAWSEWWDAAFGATGRTDTVENRIAALQAKINAANNGRNPLAREEHGFVPPVSREGVAALQYQLQDELAGQARKDADATNEADKAQAQQAGITAKTVIDSYLKRGKAASAYKDALDKLNRSFKDAEIAGTPVSADDKKVALTELKKEFAAPKNSEASQVLRAQLQNDLKGIQDALQAERDALSFQQSYLQTVYQAGGLSLTSYYDQRRKAIADGVAAELDELEKEKVRLQKYLGQTNDPSEKVQTRTRINEIDADKSKLELRASRDIVLTNEEESSSYRALSEQVTNYRANLLQMQGDEAGAAALRAQTVIANAKVLAAQATALPGAPKVDVEALTRAITITDQFNEVQRQASLLASNSARAEEAYSLAAEQSGKSLVETERGLYALRSTELAQLGALAQKAKELADASTDPKIKAFASDLALEYAKAANAIDPALNRLRDARRELASGLANTAGQAPSAFIEEYSKRRQGAADDIKRQQDEYSRKIDILEGYLATTQDKTDKARLRERIKAEESKRDSVKGESKGKSVLGAINDVVVQPMARQVFDTVNKLLITDPLQKYLEGQLKGLTEGDGMLAGFFKDALGVKANPKDIALQQQTAAITASSSALDALKTAAENAANALNQPLAGNKALGSPATTGGADQAVGNQGAGDSTQPPPVDSDLAGAQSEATQSLTEFSKQASDTASDVVKLANAAGAGGNAMVRLPGIVGLFQSAVMAMQAGSTGGSGGGGLFGAIAGLFGRSGEAGAYEEAAAATGIFHSGGIVGQPPATRNVSMNLFVGAPRYHTGGIVGKAADKVSEKLKHNEVPAILMGGPKGRREEVLRADDPRHRDNLGMSIVARILAESKSSKHSASKEAKTSESRSTVSTLLQSISGGKGKGESSANVLGSLLDRLGVKDGHESPAPNAFKVRGARELGGPVSAGGMYRVNEKGPELLQVAGKQYLMTGTQGGNVVPHGAGGKGGDTTVVHVNVTPPAGGSAASAQQWGTMAGRQIQRATRRNT